MPLWKPSYKICWTISKANTPAMTNTRVNADEIEHDPYVLISILSAWHEGVFTLDEVQSTLEMLFEKQYILTVEEEVQVRYRTETRTDSEGNPYTVEVPYNYYILHVDLENFNLSHVPRLHHGRRTAIHVRYVYVVAGKQTRPFPAIRLCV